MAGSKAQQIVNDGPAARDGSATVPASSLVLPFRVGDVLGGKYRVEKLIGEGAMGYVVAATHLELDERVALKFLRPEMLHTEGVVARFAREARAAAKVKSEYIARVFDVGILPDGAPFMVMEHLEGYDLAAVLAQRGPLPIREATEYMMQACEALAVAHTNGIVHRDLKPENLFLTRRSEGIDIVKVLDFGISKAALTGVLGAEVPLVRTMTLLGSPLYMSPEQVRASRDLDHRTDIWSLGVVLYELLTGKNAFDGQSITEVSSLILEIEPAPMRAHRPEIPDELDAIVRRCLSKSPSDRFQNVGELAMALMQFAPKRARISAERCSAVLRASGFSAEEPFPSSRPGGKLLPSAPLRVSGGPAKGRLVAPTAPHEPELASGGDRKLAATSPSFRRMRTRWVFAIGAAAILVTGLLWFRARMSSRSITAESVPSANAQGAGLENGESMRPAPKGQNPAAAASPGGKLSPAAVLSNAAREPSEQEAAPSAAPSGVAAPRSSGAGDRRTIHGPRGAEPSRVHPAPSAPSAKPTSTASAPSDPDLGY
jgi:serine/threonine protein kinase